MIVDNIALREEGTHLVAIDIFASFRLTVFLYCYKTTTSTFLYSIL